MGRGLIAQLRRGLSATPLLVMWATSITSISTSAGRSSRRNHGGRWRRPRRPEGRTPAANRLAIRQAVATVVARGAVPIIIGGDEFGADPGLRRRSHDRGPLTIVQIDAHIDWREECGRRSRRALSRPMRASLRDAACRAHRPGRAARDRLGARPGDFRGCQSVWGAIFVGRPGLLHEHGINAGARCSWPAWGSQVLVTLDCDGLDPGDTDARSNIVARRPHLLAGDRDFLADRRLKARIAAFDLVESCQSATWRAW